MQVAEDAAINMQWDYPWILLGLLALPVLKRGLRAWWHEQKVFWDAWCWLPFTRQQSRLPAARRYIVTSILFLVGFTLSVLGFASPVLQRTAYKPVWDNVALVILMDFSRSMEALRDAQDIHALSRFDEAKDSVLAFLTSLPQGVKISFVPFSEYAVPVTSGFSDDHVEIVAKVRRLQRNMFFKQGTNLTATLREGFYLAETFVNLHQDQGSATRPPAIALVLISDGDEAVTDDLQAVLAERGTTIAVFTIGVGSEQPAYIPDPESTIGYLVDEDGQPSTTVLNTDTLQFIADKTGGTYYPFAKRGQLLAALQDIIQRQGHRSQRQYTYPYPLRSYLFVGAVLCLLPVWKLEA